MRIVSVALSLLLSQAAQAGEINWWVANGFPVFSNASDFLAIKKVWQQDESASQFLAKQNAESLRRLLPVTSNTLWLPNQGRYDEQNLFRQDHEIVVRYDGASPTAQCTWFYQNLQQGKAGACSEERVLDARIKEDMPFQLRVEVSDEPEQTLSQQTITGRTILGFGDSFSSGEGNPDHAAVGSDASTQQLTKGYDLLHANNPKAYFTSGAKWWDDTCHRSLLAWQSMYALQQAISHPHQVVRFATFTCSGAEVYDGFFRAQLNPPSTGASTRVQKSPKRDGGNYLESVAKHAGQPRAEKTNALPVLNLSQLNAAVDLLCDGTTGHGSTFTRRKEYESLMLRRYYGEVKYDTCNTGKIRSVDQVLLSFGGNDFGFSGVVAWGIIPRNVYQNKNIDSPDPISKTIASTEEDFRRNMLATFRAIARVVAPEEARAAAQRDTEKLYGDVQYALSKYLAIGPQKVHALLYPNPIQSPLQEHCAQRTDQGNVAMSSVVVRLAAFIPAFPQKQAGKFQYLLRADHAQEIEDTFIRNLVSYQRAAINAQKWQAVESQPAFQGRSLCAVSQACSEGSCSDEELFAWTATGDTANASLRPIRSFANWEAYSSTRTRSLRSSNDALMTQARFTTQGRLVSDWMNGSMHPDAKAHAAIADLVDAP